MGALAEFESGLVEWQAGVESPEVELIALGAAAEAFEEVALQVDREAGRLAVRRLVVFMQRTAAAALGCLSAAGPIVQESKHVSDGDLCSDGGVVQKSADVYRSSSRVVATGFLADPCGSA